MEVESQWRREWAGAAEYGKVTEGGVTRKVARALEVLHASRPGTQVRVMRAAWHSSAGPGAPASSYMVHSSQQFISSGSRLLTSPSLIKMSQPLEISSTPLDYSPEDCTDTENYKVTEPDDFEISQPSKWKGSNNRSSVRMPSEESSSTDNASIIDLDYKNNLLKSNTWRRHSYDSDNSDVPKCKSRASPILENPITLSTLKYKSLLNHSNSSWDNRRKSYSFEDAPSINDSTIERNDISAMESSTDSGICKSSELVNEKIDEEPELHFINTNRITNQLQEDSFKDWLARNRPNRVHKIKIKIEKDKEIDEKPCTQFSLQSTGKMSISLSNEPITLSQINKDEDDLRKTKRVEFCKTELHFAAESGRVNIISTDEKPPPSNDFRKRRSAFVPIKDNFDKPVTLFGEKFDDLLVINGNNNLNEINEVEDFEENAAATKSILKNKIPKPKPYLLGENMDFGSKYSLQENIAAPKAIVIKPSAVSLINKQLEEPVCVKKKTYECREASDRTKRENEKNKNEEHTVTTRNLYTKNSTNDDLSEFKRSMKILQSSPILQGKSRTRQLKESELTYFGINSKEKENVNKTPDEFQRTYKQSDVNDINVFNAVRLVQQLSYNKPKTNKTDEELSNYQNLPLKSDYIPMPVPRTRIKADPKIEEITKGHNEIIQEIEQKIMNTRRCRLKKQDDSYKSRSISEPPKNRLTSPSSTSNRNKFKPDQKFEESNSSPVARLGEPNKSISSVKVPDKQFINHEDAPLYQNIIIEKRKTRKNNNDNNIESNDTLQKHYRPRSRTKEDSGNALTPENNKNTISSNQRDSYYLNKGNRLSSKNNNLKHEAKNIHNNNTVGKENSKGKLSQNKNFKDSITKEKDTKTRNKSSDNHSSRQLVSAGKKDNYSSEIKIGSHSYDRNNGVANDIKHDKRHKRKEYVELNYDDKNGTFSSMNKVKLRSKSSDRGKNSSSTKKISTNGKNEGKIQDTRKYPLRNAVSTPAQHTQ